MQRANVYDLIKREFVIITRSGLDFLTTRLTGSLEDLQQLLISRGFEDQLVGKLKPGMREMLAMGGGAVEGEEEGEFVEEEDFSPESLEEAET